MIQVYLGSAGALDVEGKELPRLVYVSREKRPGYQHHKKAGAMNAMVSTSWRAVVIFLVFISRCDCVIYLSLLVYLITRFECLQCLQMHPSC